MIYCRMYSLFYYFGFIVLCSLLKSHQISHRRCGFAMYPLSDSSVWVHIFRRVQRYHRPLVSRSPPAFPRRLDNHGLLQRRYPWLFGFRRSLIFRLVYHGVSRLSGRICHQDSASSACFRV